MLINKIIINLINLIIIIQMVRINYIINYINFIKDYKVAIIIKIIQFKNSFLNFNYINHKEFIYLNSFN